MLSAKVVAQRGLPRLLSLVSTRATSTLATSSISIQQQSSSPTSSTTTSRTYVSRAHPQKIEQLAVPEAMEKVMEQIALRQKKTAKRWKRNKKQREKKGIPDDGGPYRPLDETVEIAINLNVDPRKPGQSLRGSLSLPHGTGKRVNVAVFSEDADVISKAKEMGALHAGGESLMDEIVRGEISVDSFQRSLATAEVVPALSKKLARVLGPRGLMPNAKVGTVAPPDQLLELLQTQLAGQEVQYRTEKEGIIHLPVGKGSFDMEKLLGNIAAVMNKVHEIKPESYGKTTKKGGKKSVKSSDIYVISAFVSSTFGKGFKVDLRTLDPASPFFMSKVQA